MLAVIVLCWQVLTLYSCGNSEKYELVDIEFANITVDHYEYNYIEFDHDKGTYKLENKTKGTEIVSKQTGRFIVDKNDNITFTNDDIPSQDYVLYDGEKAYFSGDKLHIEAYIDGYGYVSLTYEK